MSEPLNGATDPTLTGDQPGETNGEAALGDAGKKALDAMKAERNAARAEAAAAKAELEKLKPKPEPKTEPKAADANAFDPEAFKAELRTESLREKASDKLEVAASKLLADASDAARYLNAADYVRDGKVDTAAISEAVAELVKSKPYLAKTAESKVTFEGSADQGPKGNAGKPQLTRADVERMSREGKTAEIVAARKAGQLDNLLGIKTPR